MKVYAIADVVPEGCDYLTAGKEYECHILTTKGGFWSIDDDGEHIFAKWDSCQHLNHNNWRRVEREDADCDCAELGIECRACGVTK